MIQAARETLRRRLFRRRHPALLVAIVIVFAVRPLVGDAGVGPLLFSLSVQARYAAVAEGITGQFYLAILVARLVAMHLSAVASTKERGRDS